jgi:hypothetical protein
MCCELPSQLLCIDNDVQHKQKSRLQSFQITPHELNLRLQKREFQLPREGLKPPLPWGFIHRISLQRGLQVHEDPLTLFDDALGRRNSIMGAEVRLLIFPKVIAQLAQDVAGKCDIVRDLGDAAICMLNLAAEYAELDGEAGAEICDRDHRGNDSQDFNARHGGFTSARGNIKAFCG